MYRKAYILLREMYEWNIKHFTNALLFKENVGKQVFL